VAMVVTQNLVFVEVQNRVVEPPILLFLDCVNFSICYSVKLSPRVSDTKPHWKGKLG
jgi:hypothetical protein